jgi:hypothetical protein
MMRPSLSSLETLNLKDHRIITPLPSPVAPFLSDGSTTPSGGKRTHDFFGSPVTVLPPAVTHTVEPLSNLPSAIQNSPPRTKKTAPASLGLGDSPGPRRSLSMKVSGHGLPLDPPSRLPSLLPDSISSTPSTSRPPSPVFQKEAADDLNPGCMLNEEYTIVKRLGTGAFSKVVLAKRKGEKLPVAVKAISKSSIERNDRMKISVLREVEVLKVRFCSSIQGF